MSSGFRASNDVFLLPVYSYNVTPIFKKRTMKIEKNFKNDEHDNKQVKQSPNPFVARPGSFASSLGKNQLDGLPPASSSEFVLSFVSSLNITSCSTTP